MSEIIGMRFRRNKYGLSLWEDTVAEVIYTRSIIVPGNKEISLIERFKLLKESSKKGYKLIPQILGKNTLKAYDFNEIIFYND